MLSPAKVDSKSTFTRNRRFRRKQAPMANALTQCPVEEAIPIIGREWKLLVLRSLLLNGPQRYSELLGTVRAISPKATHAKSVCYISTIGREAQCECTWGSNTAPVEAPLESGELILREADPQTDRLQRNKSNSSPRREPLLPIRRRTRFPDARSHRRDQVGSRDRDAATHTGQQTRHHWQDNGTNARSGGR